MNSTSKFRFLLSLFLCSARLSSSSRWPSRVFSFSRRLFSACSFTYRFLTPACKPSPLFAAHESFPFRSQLETFDPVVKKFGAHFLDSFIEMFFQIAIGGLVAIESHAAFRAAESLPWLLLLKPLSIPRASNSEQFWRRFFNALGGLDRFGGCVH